MNKLAINGGKKAVSIPFPHWVWPPKYKEEEKAILEQYWNGKNCSKGIPEIVDKLEIEFAEYHNSEYCLALSSATECLHTALFAAGIGPGDEVISPTYTFPATITPVFQLGGIPVLVDCDKNTGNIIPSEIEKKITKKTKAIIITHLWGRPCEMDEIVTIAKKNKLILIEDCSHAHGSTYKGKLVGTFGDISCFSFDSNKMLASGEAGLMLFKNQELFEKAIVFSDYSGRNTKQVTMKKYLSFSETGIGNKFRIHPLAAAQAYFKFTIMEDLNKERNKMCRLFNDGLKECKSIKPLDYSDEIYMGAHYGLKPLYNDGWNGDIVQSAEYREQSVKSKEVQSAEGREQSGKNNSELCTENSVLLIKDYIKILNAEGVDVRQTVTPPLHRTYLFNNIKEVYKLFPSFALNKISDYPKYKNKEFPNAEYYFKYHLSFPSFSFEKDGELIEQYIKAIKKVENSI